jgi:hypothetical protein
MKQALLKVATLQLHYFTASIVKPQVNTETSYEQTDKNPALKS